VFLKQLVIVSFSCYLVACASTNPGTDGAQDASSSGRTDCIFRSSIRGYSVLDESNLIIEGSGRRNYHVVLRQRAFGISSSWGIGFNSPTDRICAGFSEVVFDGHMDSQSIAIASIRELSPEDHEDLLIRFGKKKPEIEQTPAPADVKGAEVEELDTADTDDKSGN
jgi:Family of unknown function (DUF6491)